MSNIYVESMFIDSGAHTLYNVEVLKSAKRKGKHGRALAKPAVRWGQGDFGYYDLSPGTPFRAYCDNYAKFLKLHKDSPLLIANVDAISNPQKTWEIQKFFEKEHGVRPVPIVHYNTPMKWVDRYVEGGYKLLGVGGLGQGVSRHEYFKWADVFFTHICPAPSYLPIIRTHGFAMTSWELMCRYPWWSVDSATWVKLSAYGWLYIPRLRGDRWAYDEMPLMINFSARSPKEKKGEQPKNVPGSIMPPHEIEPAPRMMEKGKHFDNSIHAVKENCLAWLKHIGIEMGSLTAEGEVEVFGVRSHHRARSISNLIYLKELEKSRPKWPHPLDPSIVEKSAVHYSKGMGL